MTGSPNRAGRRRTLGALAACAWTLALAWSSVAQAGVAPNQGRKVALVAREQQLPVFLNDLFSQIDVPVSVSASAQADHEIAARICWSESGPRAHAECAAIVHVLVERAASLGRGFADMARSYAPRATGAVDGHRRPFVPLLSIDAERAPLGWPHHGMRYSEGRTLLSALAATAWRALRGIDETPCPGAEHWGARGCGPCRRRMRAAGLRRIQCRTETSNTFWGGVRRVD